MVFLSRLIAALAYAGAAFFLGLSLGARGELGVVQNVFAAVIPLTTLALLIFTRNGRAQTALTGLAIFAGLYLGQLQFARAWTECRTQGFTVRDALMRHHTEHDGYPSRLEDLGIDIPCRAGVRKTILHYLSNDRGFRLWITNEQEVVSFSSRARRGTHTESQRSQRYAE